MDSTFCLSLLSPTYDVMRASTKCWVSMFCSCDFSEWQVIFNSLPNSGSPHVRVSICGALINLREVCQLGHVDTPTAPSPSEPSQNGGASGDLQTSMHWRIAVARGGFRGFRNPRCEWPVSRSLARKTPPTRQRGERVWLNPCRAFVNQEC